MKNSRKICSLVIALIIAALCWTCSDYYEEPQPQIGDTLVVTYQQTISYPAENISISFDSLASDSRCPVGAICVWAGSAELVFTFSAGSKKAEISLSSLHSFGDSTVLGYNIELMDVKPYPQVGKANIPSEYSAIICIKNGDTR